MIHFDTTFLVDLLRESKRGEAGPATRFLRELDDEELGTSIHVACELFAGAALSADPGTERQRVRRVLDPLAVSVPDGSFPLVYGEILATLQRRGERIATMDLLIASAAVHASAGLVTRNVRDFARISGLEVLSY